MICMQSNVVFIHSHNILIWAKEIPFLSGLLSSLFSLALAHFLATAPVTVRHYSNMCIIIIISQLRMMWIVNRQKLGDSDWEEVSTQ